MLLKNKNKTLSEEKQRNENNKHIDHNIAYVHWLTEVYLADPIAVGFATSFIFVTG